MRRVLAALGIAFGIALGAYALLSSRTDEELILDCLEDLERAVQVDGETSTNPVLRTGAVNGSFEDIFTEDVRYSIPELTSGARGRGSLAALAVRSGMVFSTLTIDFGQADVAVGSGGSEATVRTMATVRAERRGHGLEQDERRVVFDFGKTPEGWQITRVRVASPGDGTDQSASPSSAE